jgi:alanyl-tRNA synthetase
LNWALREVLGSTVDQKGSLVDAEKTRFDFSHSRPLTPDELDCVSSLVDERVNSKLRVYTKDVDQLTARRINTLRAVFGEKYPDTVRVVSMGANIDAMLADPQNAEWMQYSVEFCGGTHLESSYDILEFRLISEEGVSKGVRRVVGVSGDVAREVQMRGLELTSRILDLDENTPNLAEQLNVFQRDLNEHVIPLHTRHFLREQLAGLQKHVKAAEKQHAAASGEQVAERVAKMLESAEVVAGVSIVIGEVPSANTDSLRAAIDWVRNKTAASAVVLGMSDGEKVTLMAGISRDAVAKVKAGDIIKEIAPIVGGKGGGRPDMAQGGGADVTKLPAALVAAKEFVRKRLGA